MAISKETITFSVNIVTIVVRKLEDTTCWPCQENVVLWSIHLYCVMICHCDCLIKVGLLGTETSGKKKGRVTRYRGYKT